MAAVEETACDFSLTCEEDGVDLGDGVVDDGDLFFLYSGAPEESEYMEQLVSKETFSSSSDCLSAAASEDDWLRQARLAAVKWILKARGCFGLGHRTAYLAIAYFDRFCLRRRVDRETMPWAARLLSIACVSVAAKMEEYTAPPLSELDDACGGGYVFCSSSIRRMELLLLSTLGWRMAAVTPFDYLPCFSSRLHRNGRGGGHGGARVALNSIGFIFATAEASSVLDRRPSAVAAAAILAASYGPLLTKDALESKMNNLSLSCLIEKEHVHACYTMMVGDLNRRISNCKRSLPCSDSINEVATSTYHTLVDDVADIAAFATAVAERNKRIRLENPGIR